ncbi:MAG: outer membrane lipoprotein-sorting protein, partial [Verrucomicrobiaceae bacterium]|nr:outer membrane lipoprotein-sorting protein [Verrucomicrobiaceae bacterium]
ALTESVFRQFSRLRADAAGRKQLETLLVCDTPARDTGKMILFARSACWFHTPQARRPTRMSAQQVATHALVADWINWSFADDFDHVRSGSEAVTGTAHPCTVLDLTPKPGVKNRASFMRCWIDPAGRLWKAEIYSSSRKLMRTVHLSHYETVLGAERASRLRIESSSKIEEVILDDVQKHSSPEDYFDPEKLPALVPLLFKPTAKPR